MGEEADVKGQDVRPQGRHESPARTVQAASDMGIGYMSVYAFSTENWKRSADEVGGLMNIAVEYFFKEIEELNQKNVRMLVLGDRSGLPEKVQEAADNAEKSTAANTGLTLNIMLNYGGRDEIIRAFREMAEEGIPADQIDEAAVSAHLYTAGQPDPDIIVGTSGEERISNFMLWQNSYSEFFVDTLWPDFGEKGICAASSKNTGNATDATVTRNEDSSDHRSRGAAAADSSDLARRLVAYRLRFVSVGRRHL